MKKIFTLISLVMLAITASADRVDLPLDNLSTGWGSTYDAATHTIVFEDAWKGRGWWLGDVDYSPYDAVCIEFEPVDCKVQVKIEYNGGVESNSAMAEVGETSVRVNLDEAGKASVKQIYIQTNVAATLVLKAAYIESTGDAPLSKDLLGGFMSKGTYEDGVLTITPTKDWDWIQYWIGDLDARAYDYLILELAEVAECNIQVILQTKNNDGTDADEVRAFLNSGDLTLKVTLPETKNHIKNIVLQNNITAPFKVKAFYLANELFVEQSTTVINNVTSVGNNVIYNLAGQRIQKMQKGINIVNGKKYINK